MCAGKRIHFRAGFTLLTPHYTYGSQLSFQQRPFLQVEIQSLSLEVCSDHRGFTRTSFLWGEYAVLYNAFVYLSSLNLQGLPLWKPAEYCMLCPSWMAALLLTGLVWKDLH